MRGGGGGVAGAAAPETAPERLSVHGQVTFVEQYHPPFPAPYTGPLSLDPGGRADETLSASLLLGARLWEGAEVYVNPELLQGFGLSNSTGIAGFPNGEAFKVGSTSPIGKLSRAFVRQTLPLGAAREPVAPGPNQLAGDRPRDRLTLTVGKYAVVDLFDDNGSAHDSRAGFLNWTVNELGAFDMASPAFNYTYGATAEWYRAWWAVRAGFFLEPTHPNSEDIDTSFRQFQPVVELEARHQIAGRPGKLKLLAFGKRVEAGSFARALAVSEATGQPPSTAAVRDHLVWGYGGGLNLEQQVLGDLAMFARASVQAGQYEEFAFTQVEESVSAGLVSTGARWGRDEDALGVALVANGIFARERAYLAAGGTGIIIGDGALDYGGEEIVEIYYKLAPWGWAAITPDYQLVNHPAYNRDRGPVSVFGVRVHLEL
jgi:high affinity Mn2+ porin